MADNTKDCIEKQSNLEADLNTPENSHETEDNEPLNMVMNDHGIHPAAYPIHGSAFYHPQPLSHFNPPEPQMNDGVYCAPVTSLSLFPTSTLADNSSQSIVKSEAKEPEQQPHEQPQQQPEHADESTSKKERRRRQKLPDKQNMFCAVCGDKANGFNFGAITCESCKAFFRRNANKTKEIVCAFENDCKLDPHTRKFCTSCRLRKCLSIDMKKEYILDEDALKKRKRLTRKSKEVESGQSTADSTSVGSGDHHKDDHNLPAVPLSETVEVEINEILNNHRLMDEEVSAAQKGAASSSQALNSSQNMKQRDLNDRNYRIGADEYNKLNNPKSTTELIQMVSGFVIKFIPFIKLIPAYDELKRMDKGIDDQVILIKQFTHEAMAMRAAAQYNPDLEGFGLEDSSTGDKKALKVDSFMHILGPELQEQLIQFVLSLNTIAKWDKPTVILTLVISLFAEDRPGLHNKEHIARASEHYSFLLDAFLRSKYTLREARVIYAKLLVKVADVRTYAELAKKKLNKDIDLSQIDPLLQELLFDSQRNE